MTPRHAQGVQLENRFVEAASSVAGRENPEQGDEDEDEVFATPEDRPYSSMAEGTPVNGKIIELELRMLLQARKSPMLRAQRLLSPLVEATVTNMLYFRPTAGEEKCGCSSDGGGAGECSIT